jgi:hypothetical protein
MHSALEVPEEFAVITYRCLRLFDLKKDEFLDRTSKRKVCEVPGQFHRHPEVK